MSNQNNIHVDSDGIMQAMDIVHAKIDPDATTDSVDDTEQDEMMEQMTEVQEIKNNNPAIY